jgi:hypothetical protein
MMVLRQREAESQETYLLYCRPEVYVKNDTTVSVRKRSAPRHAASTATTIA